MLIGHGIRIDCSGAGTENVRGRARNGIIQEKQVGAEMERSILVENRKRNTLRCDFLLQPLPFVPSVSARHASPLLM